MIDIMQTEMEDDTSSVCKDASGDAVGISTR
jgi:hypothetical protein